MKNLISRYINHLSWAAKHDKQEYIDQLLLIACGASLIVFYIVLNHS